MNVAGCHSRPGCLVWDQACAEGHVVLLSQASLGSERHRQAVQ